MGRRVGLFGGTFDPPHLGHTAVAADVADALELDRVIWIPAGIPPHKQDQETSPPAVRLRMARAATEVDPRFVVSDIEIVRDGPSYTVDTLRALRDGPHESDELFLIIGYDEFEILDSWREPEKLTELAELVVMNREGASLTDDSETPLSERAPVDPDRVRHVPVTRVDISSSEIRRRVASGEDASSMVPPEVWRIIEHEDLYRDGRAAG